MSILDSGHRGFSKIMQRQHLSAAQKKSFRNQVDELCTTIDDIAKDVKQNFRNSLCAIDNVIELIDAETLTKKITEQFNQAYHSLNLCCKGFEEQHQQWFNKTYAELTVMYNIKNNKKPCVEIGDSSSSEDDLEIVSEIKPNNSSQQSTNAYVGTVDYVDYGESRVFDSRSVLQKEKSKNNDRNPELLEDDLTITSCFHPTGTDKTKVDTIQVSDNDRDNSKKAVIEDNNNVTVKIQDESIHIIDDEDEPLPAADNNVDFSSEIDRIHDAKTPPPPENSQIPFDALGHDANFMNLEVVRAVKNEKALQDKESRQNTPDTLNDESEKTSKSKLDRGTKDKLTNLLGDESDEDPKEKIKTKPFDIHLNRLGSSILKKHKRAIRRSMKYMKKINSEEYKLKQRHETHQTHQGSSKSIPKSNDDDIVERAINLDHIENSKKRQYKSLESDDGSSGSKKKSSSNKKKFKKSQDDSSINNGDGFEYYSEDEDLSEPVLFLIDSEPESYYIDSPDSEDHIKNSLLNDYSGSEQSEENTLLSQSSEAKKKKKKKKKKSKRKETVPNQLAFSESEDEGGKKKTSEWRKYDILNFKDKSDSDSSADKDLSKVKGRKKSQPLNYATSEDSEPNTTEQQTDNDNAQKQDANAPKQDAVPGPSKKLFNHAEYGKNLKVTIPGRRNIREVMDDEDTTEATRKAIKDENLRAQRVTKRNEELEALQAQGIIISSSIILDFDSASRKELITIDKGFAEHLKPHQKQGVKFMWDACFESLKHSKETAGGGCILAHCMGLGKTFQVITLIHTLLTHPEIGVKKVMVICPTNTVLNWVEEFSKWLNKAKKKCNHAILHLIKEKALADRLPKLQSWNLNGGVLVISYELFRSLNSYIKERKNMSREDVKLMHEYMLDPGADLLICDEGHLIKRDDSALSSVLKLIRTKRKIVLTGTPLQNNLSEYHCMVSFVKEHLLGSKDEFMNRFNNPIVNGQYHNSNVKDVQLMKGRSHVLHRILENCVLRRDHTILLKYLPSKYEYAIYIQPSDLQMKMYLHFLDIKHVIDGRSQFFNNYHMLNLILAHPCTMLYSELSKQNNYSSNENEKKNTRHGGREENKKKNFWWDKFIEKKHTEMVDLSNKLILLFHILQKCERNGEKLLVFSHGLNQLDLIEHFLDKFSKSETNPFNLHNKWKKNVDYLRLDGRVKPEERAEACKIFNNSENKRTRLFLISTRAGGLGINLVGANRVVLFEPAWNPSRDTQSIFRVFRFGQEKPCYIYRFLAAGTIEHSIYNRAVTKVSLAHRVLDDKQMERHYTKQELSELYKLDLRDENPVFDPPKDPLLKDLIIELKENGNIYNCKEHESLFKDQEQEKLNPVDREQAWLNYHSMNEEIAKAKQKPRKRVAENNVVNNVVVENAVNETESG